MRACCQRGRVIGAGDRKACRCLGRGCAIRHLHGEAIGDRLTCCQGLGRRFCVVQRVADHPAGDGERRGAVGTSLGVGGSSVDRDPSIARQVGDIKAGCAIYIAFGERNGGAGCARCGVGHACGFHQLYALRACCQRGRVIGAGDGDGDGLRRTVSGRHREGVVQRRRLRQGLHRGVAVVQCVGPHTGRAHGVGAIAADRGAACCGSSKEVGGAVHVVAQERTGGCWGSDCGVGHACGFNDVAGAGAADRGRVVDVGDAQGVAGGHGCAARYGAVGHVDGDGVAGFCFIVQRDTGLEVKGCAVHLEVSCIIARERDRVGTQRIVGDRDVSHFDSAGRGGVFCQAAGRARQGYGRGCVIHVDQRVQRVGYGAVHRAAIDQASQAGLHRGGQDGAQAGGAVGDGDARGQRLREFGCALVTGLLHLAEGVQCHAVKVGACVGIALRINGCCRCGAQQVIAVQEQFGHSFVAAADGGGAGGGLRRVVRDPCQQCCHVGQGRDVGGHARTLPEGEHGHQDGHGFCRACGLVHVGGYVCVGWLSVVYLEHHAGLFDQREAVRTIGIDDGAADQCAGGIEGLDHQIATRVGCQRAGHDAALQDDAGCDGNDWRDLRCGSVLVRICKRHAERHVARGDVGGREINGPFTGICAHCHVCGRGYSAVGIFPCHGDGAVLVCVAAHGECAIGQIRQIQGSRHLRSDVGAVGQTVHSGIATIAVGCVAGGVLHTGFKGDRTLRDVAVWVKGKLGCRERGLPGVHAVATCDHDRRFDDGRVAINPDADGLANFGGGGATDGKAACSLAGVDGVVCGDCSVHGDVEGGGVERECQCFGRADVASEVGLAHFDLVVTVCGGGGVGVAPGAGDLPDAIGVFVADLVFDEGTDFTGDAQAGVGGNEVAILASNAAAGVVGEQNIGGGSCGVEGEDQGAGGQADVAVLVGLADQHALGAIAGQREAGAGAGDPVAAVVCAVFPG